MTIYLVNFPKPKLLSIRCGLTNGLDIVKMEFNLGLLPKIVVYKSILISLPSTIGKHTHFPCIPSLHTHGLIWL